MSWPRAVQEAIDYLLAETGCRFEMVCEAGKEVKLSWRGPGGMWCDAESDRFDTALVNAARLVYRLRYLKALKETEEEREKLKNLEEAQNALEAEKEEKKV